MAIAIRPGTMNTSYSTLPSCRMRPPSERPNTTMNSIEAITGASTVCVQSLDTRRVSRRQSQKSPVTSSWPSRRRPAAG